MIRPVVWVLCALAGTQPAFAADLEPFFGTFVGRAEVYDPDTERRAERDMDVVIKRYQRNGIQADWISVTLVDGRRDVAGVERRTNTAIFQPVRRKGFYEAVEGYDPFRERDDRSAMEGAATRWARFDQGVSYVYSFAITEDGGYELQVYERELTDLGMDLRYRSIVDGAIRREIVGTMVRVEDDG
ncbi:MAG: hypothetical protein ACFB3T_01905 [Geminicoccaceae bacterium]